MGFGDEPASRHLTSGKSACAQYISAPGPSSFLGGGSWLSFGLDFRREVFPQRAFSPRGTHHAVSGFKHLNGLVRIRNSHSSRTVHHHQAKGGHRHVRYNEQCRPGTTAVNHHQTLRALAPARHRLDVETHRVRVSGAASVADQLILMSMISPRGRCKASISSGSSPATEAECGHHAPSMSLPSVPARAIRTGRAHRRAPVRPFTRSA